MGLLLTLFFLAATTLAFTHTLATSFFLYWKYLWLDIPMHFLGGLVCALGIAILPFFRLQYIEKRSSLSLYMFLVLGMGICWELFEYSTGMYQFETNIIPDTILDMCMDLFGGAIGYGVVKSIKQLDS